MVFSWFFLSQIVARRARVVVFAACALRKLRMIGLLICKPATLHSVKIAMAIMFPFSRFTRWRVIALPYGCYYAAIAAQCNPPCNFFYTVLR